MKQENSLIYSMSTLKKSLLSGPLQRDYLRDTTKVIQGAREFYIFGTQRTRYYSLFYPEINKGRIDLIFLVPAGLGIRLSNWIRKLSVFYPRNFEVSVHPLGEGHTWLTKGTLDLIREEVAVANTTEGMKG